MNIEALVKRIDAGTARAFVTAARHVHGRPDCGSRDVGCRCRLIVSPCPQVVFGVVHFYYGGDALGGLAGDGKDMFPDGGERQVSATGGHLSLLTPGRFCVL